MRNESLLLQSEDRLEIGVDHAFTPSPSRREDILKRELGFGKYFTDRMFTVRWDTQRGWHRPLVGPFEDFRLSPAAAVLHYGQAIFEGQKAFYRADGEIGLFRPAMNASRIRESARRLVMPEVPEGLFVRGLETLLDLERAWVPRGELQSLYIRPFCVATEPMLGVRAAAEYLFAIILSPVGAYYATGFTPVDILVSEDLARAAVGGTGAVKAAGNYGASLLAGRRAKDSGCAQVLWLDAAEHRYIEEIGAMNVMFVLDGTLVTPALSGSILPGVTRDSILSLARAEGLPVEERRLSIDEVVSAIENNRCSESFGCGTAAVVTAIGSFLYRGKSYRLPSAPGPIAQRMFQTITDLQWGRRPDTHGWIHIVPRGQ
jgi:branched-chain amino acid aminotransferase